MPRSQNGEKKIEKDFFLNNSPRKSLSSRGISFYRREGGYCLTKLLAQKPMISPHVPFLVDQTAVMARVLESLASRD